MGNTDFFSEMTIYFQCGYRFIDCANDYDNEDVIGEALQELFDEGVCKRWTAAKVWQLQCFFNPTPTLPILEDKESQNRLENVMVDPK